MIFSDLVKTLPCAVCVRLFVELEGNSPLAIVIGTFMTEAISALDELVLKNVSNYTVCFYTVNI